MACGDVCCGSDPGAAQHDRSASDVAPLSRPSEPSGDAHAHADDNVDIVSSRVSKDNDGCATSGCCQSAADKVEAVAPVGIADDCCSPMSVAATTVPTNAEDCCKSKNNDKKDEMSCCSVDAPETSLAQATARVSCTVQGNVAAEAQDASCCNGNPVDSQATGSYCSSKEAEKKDKDACCDEESTTVANAEDCCSSKPASKSADSCCSPEKPATCQDATELSDDNTPDCCKGKTSPCCDEDCIERIALRECQSSTQGSFRSFASPHHHTNTPSASRSSPEKDCKQGKDGKPCTSHSQSARSRYQARLQALGCICRALIARGQESCCPRTPKMGPMSKRSGSLKSRSSNSIRSSYSNIDAKQHTFVSSASLKDCEQSGLPAKVSLGCAKGCCTSPKVEKQPKVKGCADACCDSKTASGITASKSPDIEKHNGADKEHIVIAISGMTCTGCETKLQRTLGVLNPIVNLKTSLILSRVEFDLNPGELSAEDVIKHLERTTEFKCDKINTLTSSLDLSCDGNASELVNGQWPKGVLDVRAVEKGAIVRVDFDSTLIGARDLVEKGWERPMKLAPSRLDPGLEAGSKHVRHMGIMTLLSICLTIPVLVMSWAPLPKRELAYSSASLALATIVQFVIAGPFYPKAIKSLVFSRIIEMDLLIVLSTSAAYIFSVVSFGYLVSGQPLSTGEFFETSTLLVTLIMVGRYVAALARQKAVESISIRSLQTSTATIVDDAGSEKQIDTRLLQLGDVFRVAPESKVPTDGTVISGHSEIDEAMLTGESVPVEKLSGSVVIAGSINGSGSLTVRLTRLPEHNTISTIASMVDEAKLSKPKIQEFADQVASYFVPVIIGLTIITFIIWIAVGVAVRNQSGREATIRAVTYAITVLIVSCPCAIGLAVPMVIVISTGMAAERGIIFKSSQSIEVAYKTSHVVFDKTGTLTAGKLAVCAEEFFGDDSPTAMSLLLGLIDENKHPVSMAVASYLKDKGTITSKVSDAKVLAGKGVEGTYMGRALRAGHSRWLGTAARPEVQSMLSRGYTVFCFTVDGTLAAVFGLNDQVRPDAISTIAELKAGGIEVHVLSGDDDGAVRGVTTVLDVPQDKVRSRCSPADKQDYIKSLIAPIVDPSGKTKNPVVIFCGDGTNDAVALAGATIGIHMNGGTDVAQSAADVILVRPDLSRILTVITLSRKSIHRIAFNFGWSFVYNLFAILLASGAFVNARIPPEYAGLGELASVLPVIAAAALLRWSKV